MASASQLQRYSLHVINALKPFVKANPSDRALRLSSVVLSEEALRKIKMFVCMASESKDELSTTTRLLWGAGLMVLGVKAARAYGGGGFDWSNVLAEAGCALAYPEKSQEYDWIENGCKKFLSISLIRAHQKRRVLGTMLQQAGACVVYLRELSIFIRRRWSWQDLAAEVKGGRPEADQVDLIARWLLEDILPTLPSGTLHTQITEKEPRFALAAALRELALLWAHIEALGLLRDTAEETLEALQRADAEGAHIFADAGKEASLAILGEMFPASAGAQTERLEAWCWQWVEGPGFGQLILVPPERMAFDRALPSDTLSVRFKLQGSAQRSDSLPVFDRSGDFLILKHGKHFLVPPSPLSTTHALSAEWRDSQGMRERVLKEVALLNSPVAIFDALSGEQVRAAPAEKNIILLFERGLHVACEHEAFRRDPHSSKRLGVEIWRGLMPREDVTFGLTTPDEEGTEWLTLSPPHLRLDIEPSLRSRPLYDLRTHYHPIFAYWPHWMTEEIDCGDELIERRNHAGTWEVIYRGAYRIAAKNVLSGYAPGVDDDVLGLYRVTFQRERRTRRMVFGVLPPSFELRVERRRQDTTVEALTQDPKGSLVLLNPQTQVREARRALAPREEPYVVPFVARSAEGLLRGSLHVAHPATCVRVFEGQDPTEGEAYDLSFLPASLLKTASGGLWISGAPRQRIKIISGDHCVDLSLNAEGHTAWRFYTLPLALKESNALTLAVEWQGSHHVQQVLRFSSATAIKPFVNATWSQTTEGSDSNLCVALSAVLMSAEALSLEDMSLWLVPAFAPWMPPQVLPVTASPVSWDKREASPLPARPLGHASAPLYGGHAITASERPKEVGIEVRADWQINLSDAGPYMVGLMCKQRPCSGLSLAWVGPNQGPPEQLSALSKALWEPPTTDQMPHLYRLLRHQLRGVNAHALLIDPLMNAISRFGSVYFRIAEPLGLALGRERLRAALCATWTSNPEARTRAYQLVDFVRDMLDIPWASVQFEDLQAELAAAQPSQIEPWLETLNGYQAGFLVAAVECFMRDEKTVHLLSAPSAQRLQSLVKTAWQWPGVLCALGEDALHYLRTPETDPLNPEAGLEVLLSSPRFAGLVEARKRLLSLDDLTRKLCKSKDATLRVVEGFPQTVQAQHLRQRRIPDSVQCVEITIAAVTWQVHQWRTRDVVPSLTDWTTQGGAARLSFLELQKHFPTLVDFWLNLWAKRDIKLPEIKPQANPQHRPQAPQRGVLVRRHET